MVTQLEPAADRLAPPIPDRTGLDLPTAAWRLLCAFAFSIPFSIAIAQTLLVSAAVVAALDWRSRGRPAPSTPLDFPILAFALSGLLGAVLGLSFWDSFWGLRTYLQVVIIYLVYGYATSSDRALRLVHCFLGGSAITAAYALLGALAPSLFPRLFLGSMTQSGQLLFAIGFALALVLGRVSEARWLPFALVLYGLALVVNLKRGVWLGTLASITATGLLASRRVVLVAGIVIALAMIATPPVRERIANSTRDLSLPGNRYDIWAAAVDVIGRFPMGVGRKNGEILRDYPNIPKHHKHAHDNLLQVTMENGFLGLAAFLWWMGRFAALSWRACRYPPRDDAGLRAVAVAVFATFVGFQVAGLVEYNFGDSEVLEAFFLTMGLGLVADERSRGEG
jgi:O-antigen ligase